MQKDITLGELEQQVRLVVDDVRQRHASYVIWDGDKPSTVVVPYADYLRLQRYDGNL